MSQNQMSPDGTGGAALSGNIKVTREEWLKHALAALIKDGVEGVCEFVDVLQQRLLLAGAIEHATEEDFAAAGLIGLHADEVLFEDGVLILLQAGAHLGEPGFVG